jgi:hypothetical protein
MTFDEDVRETLRRAAAELLGRHAEVRTVAAVADYRDDLVKADDGRPPCRVVWVGAADTPAGADEILGGLYATLRLFGLQLRAAEDLVVSLVGRVDALGRSVRESYEKATEIEARLRAAAGGLAPPRDGQGPAAAAPERGGAG